MFLPEKFRLPTNITDMVALQVNLNLHASLVCLHSAAYDAVNKYGLDKRLGERSKVRRLNSAREVVKIMRLARETVSPYVSAALSHTSAMMGRDLLTVPQQKNPLVALSLYCASTVYVDLAREAFSSPSPVILPPWATSELEFLVECLESIGRQHIITRAYLNQLLLDIEQSDVGTFFNLPNIKRYGCCNHGIPLLVRTAVSKHTKNGGRPLVPRMMPMGGRIIPEEASGSGSGGGCGMTRAQACGSSNTDSGMPGTEPPPESELGACSGGMQCPGKQNQTGNTTRTSGGSGPGLAPETKRRRVHHEQQSFVERIDLSDLFKFGSSALPFQHQYQHHQPSSTALPNLSTGGGDEFNDGWGPGPATAVGPPHLMTADEDTSRPVVQLPHRTINTPSTTMFSDNNTGTSHSEFDPNHNPLEDFSNMDMFDDANGMEGMGDIGQVDLDLTNGMVDSTFWNTGNDNDANGGNANDLGNNTITCPGKCHLLGSLDGIGDGNGNDNNGAITTGVSGHGGDGSDAWMLLSDEAGNSGTGAATGEESPGTGTGSWDNII